MTNQCNVLILSTEFSLCFFSKALSRIGAGVEHEFVLLEESVENVKENKYKFNYNRATNQNNAIEILEKSCPQNPIHLVIILCNDEWSEQEYIAVLKKAQEKKIQLRYAIDKKGNNKRLSMFAEVDVNYDTNFIKRVERQLELLFNGKDSQ